MSNLSQEKAREIIKDVRMNNGGITAEDRDRLVASEQSDMLVALQRMRRQLADSIKLYLTFPCRESG